MPEPTTRKLPPTCECEHAKHGGRCIRRPSVAHRTDYGTFQVCAACAAEQCMPRAAEPATVSRPEPLAWHYDALVIERDRLRSAQETLSGDGAELAALARRAPYVARIGSVIAAARVVLAKDGAA